MAETIEERIQKAAISGNWNDYQLLFNEWEKMHGGKIPPDKIKKTFLGIYESPLISMSSGHIPDLSPFGSPLYHILLFFPHVLNKDHTKDDDDFFNIVNHMLLECMKAPDWEKYFTIFPRDYVVSPFDIDTLESKGELVASSSRYIYSSSIPEFAVKNRAAILYNNPVVKREVLIKLIEDKLAKCEIKQARTLYEENKEIIKIDFTTILNNSFKYNFAKIIQQEPNKKREMFDDLLASNDATIDLFRHLLEVKFPDNPRWNYLSNIIVDQYSVYPLIKIFKLLKDHPNDPDAVSEVKALIDECLDDLPEDKILPIASSIFNACIEFWGTNTPFDPVSYRSLPIQKDPKKEEIMLMLQEKGVVFSHKLFYLPDKYCFNLFIDLGHFNLLKHPQIDKYLSNVDYVILREFAEHIMVEAMHGRLSVDDFKTTFGMLSAKSPKKLTKDSYHFFRDYGFRLLGDDREKAIFNQILAYYLRQDLFDDIETKENDVGEWERHQKFMKPDIGIINPKTQRQFTLSEYVESEPLLKAAWEKPIRDRIALKQLALTKATIEDYSSADIEERKALPESIVQHGEYTYNIVEIQEFMHAFPDVAKNILIQLDTVSRSPAAKDRFANMLQKIALNSLESQSQELQMAQNLTSTEPATTTGTREIQTKPEPSLVSEPNLDIAKINRDIIALVKKRAEDESKARIKDQAHLNRKFALNKIINHIHSHYVSNAAIIDLNDIEDAISKSLSDDPIALASFIAGISPQSSSGIRQESRYFALKNKCHEIASAENIQQASTKKMGR